MTSEHMALLNKGRAKEVVVALEIESERDKSNMEVRRDLALAYSYAGEIDQAIREYEILLAQDPQDAVALVNLGYIRLQQDEFNEARDAFDQVVHAARVKGVEDAALSLAYTNRGVVHEKQAHFEQAVLDYHVAIAIYPENTLAPKYLNELKEYGDLDRGLWRVRVMPDGNTVPDLWYYQEPENYLENQEVLLAASIVKPVNATTEGQLIQAVAIPWLAIISEIERDPAFLFRISWRKLEELVAGAYETAGWPDVVLTPRSGDKGRDVIATKPGIGSIRIYDQVKAYAPNRKVTANDVRALLGVLTVQQNVSKGIITTTADLESGIAEEFRGLIPYRLEVRNGVALRKWLGEISRLTPEQAAVARFLERLGRRRNV